MNEIASMCPYRENNCDFTKCGCAKYLAYKDVQNPEKVKEELKVMGYDIENMGTFELLMSIQKSFEEKFHTSTNGVDNLNKEQRELWINRYIVCIEDEVREVREHLNIYPGKSGKTNEPELQKEIIDILHFMMDEFICGGADSKKIEEAYLKEFFPHVTSVSDLIEFAWEYQDDPRDRFNKLSYDMSSLLLINELLDCNAMVRQCITWKHWKKPLEKIDYDKLYKAFAYTFKTFIDLCIYNRMWPKNIKEIYIKKNLENRFRQHHNY